MTSNELPIATRWTGPIAVDDDGGVAGIVIRDDEAYDALRARLPAQRIQQRQPAPPSDDPLRARPPIDFAHEMLVVVTRAGSMAPLTIARVFATEADVIVRFAAAPPPPEALASGIGVYAAALVPRAEGELELLGPRVLTEDAELEGAIGELVTLRGTLSNTRTPSILGVDVDEGNAGRDQAVEATGWLERDVVGRAELDQRIAREGQVANRGAGVFLQLIAPDGAGLAPARRRH